MNDEFPFTQTIEVSFRDIDALGHVNNAVYLTYVETARIKYLTRVLGLTSLSELSVVMAEVTCTYKSPAFYGELLHIGVGVTRFGTKSCTMAHRITANDGRLVATGQTVLVMFDQRSRTTFPIPPETKQRILDFQNGWQLPEGAK